jgi:3-oxoadipate enol-lactonase
MPVIITHDTSIDYDVHGDGPPLILINGLGFGRWGWFKQVPTLSVYFKTITFDIRGEQNLPHGVADLCAEVVALLDHLGVEKTHVLGTSLGGFVAQELALKRPELVDRLVLVCTSYGGVGPDPMSPEAFGKMFGVGSFTPESAVRRGLETATSDTYREEHPEEFDLIVRWRLADSPSLSGYAQQVMAGFRFDDSRYVGNITSPTLVIHGAEDRYVPVANANALAEAIPGSKLRILDDAGHLVFIERAEEVNKEIVSFLKPREAIPRKRRRRAQEPSTARKIFSFIKPLEVRKARKSPAKRRTNRLIGWVRRTYEGFFTFAEPREGRETGKSAARQKTGQTAGRARGSGWDVFPFLGSREPRKTKQGGNLGRKGRHRRPLRVTGDWARKVRGWFSR